MAIQSVRRTYRASIQNQHQVRDGLDALGFAASKLWNVGRWTVARVWDACGQIPTAFDLQKYLKKHERYGDLHSQSSQRVLAELGEAFEGWYEHRRQSNDTANPPGYRKHDDDHPPLDSHVQTEGLQTRRETRVSSALEGPKPQNPPERLRVVFLRDTPRR